MTRPRVLVVDDKENMRKLFVRILGHSYDVATAIDGRDALRQLGEHSFEVVLTDVKMPGLDGFGVLRAVKRLSPETEVVMMTAYGSVARAVEAMREGAYDYVTKPFDPDDVALVLARAVERRRSASQGVAESPPVVVPAVGDLAQLPYRDAVDEARDQVSREYLTVLMRDFAGNVTRAAERAGMERESLHRLLRRYGVRSEDFKER